MAVTADELADLPFDQHGDTTSHPSRLSHCQSIIKVDPRTVDDKDERACALETACPLLDDKAIGPTYGSTVGLKLVWVF
jgi:hypothetical protein